MLKNVCFILFGCVGFLSFPAQALPHASDAFWQPLRFWQSDPAVTLTTPAFSTIRSVQVAGRVAVGGFRIELLSVVVRGNEVRATFFSIPQLDDFPLPFSRGQFDVPPLPPGDYELTLATTTDATTVTDRRALKVTGVAAAFIVLPMAQFAEPLTLVAATPPELQPIGQFRERQYLALSEAEATSLLNLNLYTPPGAIRAGPRAPPYWLQAEAPFKAWPATSDAPASAVPVCRLFHPTAVTHFYSANQNDCAALRRTAPWVDEGIAFRIFLPSATGTCTLGTQPIYRLFNASLANHRYTASAGTYEALQSKGWQPEGAVFCSPTG